MAATFDPGLADDVSKVRQKIGDTAVAKAQIQDETIQAYLDTPMTILGAAKRLALDLAAKWASVGDVMIDDQLQRASHISKAYIDLAQALAKEEMGSTPASPSGGGAAIMVGGIGDRRGPLDDCPAAYYN